MKKAGRGANAKKILGVQQVSGKKGKRSAIVPFWYGPIKLFEHLGFIE